jgi:glycoside/pentoside/hexuronide:cation symporter, GPH family
LTERSAVALSLPTQIAYGAGQVAGQVFRDVPSLLLLFFMTSVLGISPALAGSSIFIPKLIGGVFFDVSVGVASDRLAGRFARRNWLLIGAIAAPAAMIALFHVPTGSEATMAGYVAVAFALYMAAFASFSVPYLAVAGDLMLSAHQRTVLMAWRLAFTALGVLVAGAIAPAWAASAGGGRQGYAAMALMLAILSTVSLLIGWWGAGRAERETGVRPAPQTALTLSSALTALADPRFSVLAAVNLLQLVAAGMAYAGLMYFITYNLGIADALSRVGPVVLISCLGIIAAQPMWVKLAARIGKQRAYVIAALIHALAHLGWATASWGGLPVLYGFALVLGIGNSGWAMLGFAMVGDMADEGKAGLYSAVYIALDKVAFALGGALIIGLILSAFGFDAGAAAQGGPQPGSAMTGILIAFALAPAACNIIAAAVFAKWGRVGGLSDPD